MTARYVPKQGDIVWLDFTPQSGHEQAGHRPALVLSPEAYNRKVGLMLCCPITTQVKGYPFEVELTGVRGVSGVVLSDQIKSLDWESRHAEFKGKAPSAAVRDVLAKVHTLLEVERPD